MTLTRPASMNPIPLWLISAAFGMASAMVTGVVGLGAVVVALVLAIPLVLRGDPLAAISGLLVGFGALWLFLLARQFASGGSLNNPERWILVGAAPLAVGLVALVLALFAPSLDA